MSDAIARRHGLEPILAATPSLAGADIGLIIEIQAELGHINLRGASEDNKFVAAVKDIVGQDLPVQANTISNGEHRIFWLGPDEWLIVTSLDSCDELLGRLGTALEGLQASVTDVSGGQVLLRLGGSSVLDVLAKGCTLDFQPEVFSVGACAQSGLAKAHILIGLINDDPVFDLIVRRSFSEYVVLWLKHAASEYGVMISGS